MIDILVLATLLTELSDAHHTMGTAYTNLAHHVGPRAGYVDADTLMVARAIQGEEAGQFGDRREELGTWIAHVAYNRYQKEWWQRIDGVPCTFAERTEHDFHGTALVPEEDVENWAVRIAYAVLEERRAGGIDRANGALFAMSLVDLQNHGWLERAREVLVHVVSAPDSLAQFWMMNDDPEKEASE